MSGTYGIVNLVSSFGFCWRWRRQCIDQIQLNEGDVVCDLMTGMGEMCLGVAPKIGSQGRILAVDNSADMCKIARQRQYSKLGCNVEIVEADALHSDLADASTDVIVSSFGLKTFSDPQLEQLAAEIRRLLKPGGQFSLIEISVPPSLWLRVPYLFYLNHIIPIVGRMLMGNPDNYRLLGVYTTAFGNCQSAVDAFRDAGLEIEVRSFFMGCASGLVGRLPSN